MLTTTDGRTTDDCLYYKLTYELKKLIIVIIVVIRFLCLQHFVCIVYYHGPGYHLLREEQSSWLPVVLCDTLCRLWCFSYFPICVWDGMRHSMVSVPDHLLLLVVLFLLEMKDDDAMLLNCINEPAHESMVLITLATCECSDEPAHLRSIARAFAVRTHEVWK